jgi:iron-sulfur cluster assembly protein
MIPNVTVTAAAEKFLRRVVRFSGLPASAGLRLTVTSGGCSGYQSDFTVESSPRAGDSVLDVNGLRLFLPAESRLLLDGVTIDFADTPTQTGLTFVSPAGAPCACSTSAPGPQPAVARVDVASIRHAPPRTPTR